MHFGKSLRIHLRNGRVFVGRLILLDKDMNVCLDECKEVYANTRQRRCVNPSCDFCICSIVRWDVVHIFGEDIKEVFLEDDYKFKGK